MKALHRYKETIALGFILITAAFLRLYRIADYLTFLGDEGRDALVVKGILEGNLVFLGPRASSGDFFLGPVYYYMMAPFFWISGQSPVGPAVMVALLGVATVYLVYRIGKEFFGTTAGLIAAALYAVSTLVVQFSKSSWNPNAVPFFALLLIYCLYKAVKHNSWKLYLAVGVIFGILMQLHYIVVFLGLIIGAYILVGNFLAGKKSVLPRIINIIRGVVFTLIGFIIGLAPFLAFEIKNGFPNIRTILTFVSANTVGGQTSSAPMYWIISDVFLRVFGRLLVVFPTNQVQNTMDPVHLGIWIGIVVLLAATSIIALIRTNDRLFTVLLLLWVTLGIILFGFYKKPIYDYYFVFLFPAPFLLIGNLLSRLYYSAKRFALPAKGVVVVAFISLIVINLMNTHLRTEPNRQLMQMENISEFVLSKTDPGPFNFALITDGNSDHAYRFFFSMRDRDPVIIENEMNDPKRATVTKQLLVICEEIPCSPLGHPLFEVAAFGRAEIEGRWDLSLDKGKLYPTPKGERPFVIVYKLKHFEGEE